jgi:hypothetical protein
VRRADHSPRGVLPTWTVAPQKIKCEVEFQTIDAFKNVYLAVEKYKNNKLSRVGNEEVIQY